MVDVPFLIIAVVALVFVLAIVLIVTRVTPPPGPAPGPSPGPTPGPVEDLTPTTLLGTTNLPLAGCTSIAAARTTAGTDLIFVGNPTGAGRVYVYSRTNAAMPTLLTTILAPPGVTGFGQSVACSENGDDLVVGAPDTGMTLNTGYVGFYQKASPTTWSLVHSDTSVTPTTVVTSKFGYSVAMAPDGRLVAVGEPGARDGDGLVTIYTRPVYGVWTAVQRFNASETGASVGKSVSISNQGAIVAVGGDGLVWFHAKNGSGMFSQIKVLTASASPVVAAGVDVIGYTKDASNFDLVTAGGDVILADAIAAVYGADASPTGRSIAVASGTGSVLYHRSPAGTWSIAASSYGPGIGISLSGVAVYVLTSTSFKIYI